MEKQDVADVKSFIANQLMIFENQTLARYRESERSKKFSTLRKFNKKKRKDAGKKRKNKATRQSAATSEFAEQVKRDINALLVNIRSTLTESVETSADIDLSTFKDKFYEFRDKVFIII